VTAFVDSNIPMYLVGADHPNKHAARIALERAIADGERLVTDAEVLQEILHRYVAIDRRDAIGPATELLLAVVDEVVAVDADLVLAAGRLVQRVARLSARDALHVAAMRRDGIDDILTFDRGFDAITGIRRRPG
jgi:predicted nucleic acid-binding protein